MSNNYNDSLLGQNASGPPRMGIQKLDPSVAAVLNKLVTPTTTGTVQATTGNRQQAQIVGPDMSLMDRISDTTASNVVDAESLLQLMPDLEMAMQVLIATILSPKDLVDAELTYQVEPNTVPTEFATPMLEVIRDHFENNYKISEELPDILRDSLFMKGADPVLVLPETTIDHAINSGARVSTESLSQILDSRTKMPRNIGILANVSNDKNASDDKLTLESLFAHVNSHQVGAYDATVGKLSFEMLHQEPPDKDNPLPEPRRVKVAFDPMLTVTDNPQILRVPELLSKMRKDRLQDLLRPVGLASEAWVGEDRYARTKREGVAGNVAGVGLSDEASAAKQRGSLYRSRHFTSQQIVSLAKPSMLTRESVGHPLVTHLPAECVIPVHVPGSPEEHLGYFVLVDQTGNPINKATESDYYAEMANNLKSNRDMTSQMIANTKRHTTGSDWYNRQVDTDEMTRIYTDLVEVELNQRLRAGLLGNNVQVSKPQEVYRIMFARALAGMHTQALYVPAEMLTYYAFDYNQYGVGISLLQKSKIIGGLRAMLLFADMMAAIKNSVGQTLVNVTLDEQDPDPVSTMEAVVHEFAYGRSNGLMPMGATNPRDIVNYMSQASVQYAVSGNPRYPTTQVAVEDRQSNRTKPDKELQDDLKKRQLNSLGVAPETIDAAAGPDFAVSVANNNLMSGKRVVAWQRKLTRQVQQFIGCYTLNSGILMEALRKVVTDQMQKATTDPKGQHALSLKEKRNNASDLSQNSVDSYAQAHSNDNDVDALVVDFIHALRVELPKPDVTTGKMQIEAFDAYTEGLDKALQAYITPDFMQSLEMGSSKDDVASAVSYIKAYFVRDWLRSNRIYPELEALVAMEDGKPVLDIAKSAAAHVELLRGSMGQYIKDVLKNFKQYDQDLAKLKNNAGVDDTGGGGYTPDTSSTASDLGGGDGMGDIGGMDDLGGDDDLGGEPDSTEEAEETDQDDTAADDAPPEA